MSDAEMPVALKVESEYGTLEAVLVHEPGFEVDRLTVSNRERLLFEDIPYLTPMNAEHRHFASVLEAQGVRVLRMGELLRDLLQERQIRRRLVLDASSASGHPDLGSLLLEHFDDDADRIYKLLLFGVTAGELYDETGLALHPLTRDADDFLIEPLPNAYFTRDPAVVISSALISCNMH